jgi:hypothetical protein
MPVLQRRKTKREKVAGAMQGSKFDGVSDRETREGWPPADY